MGSRVPAADRTAPDRRVACCCGDRRQRALGAGDRLGRGTGPRDPGPGPTRLGRRRGDGARACGDRCRRCVRLPRRWVAGAHGSALVERLLAADGHSGRPGGRRRLRRHALQRRGDGGERRGAGEGLRRRRGRRRLDRDEPRRPRHAGRGDAEPSRAAGGLGLSDRARAGGGSACCRRDEERPRRGQRAACRAHGRSRGPADGHRDPGRSCRGGGLDAGRRSRRDHAVDDDSGEARPTRRRASEVAQTAAEAARAERPPEPARLRLPAAADRRLGAAVARRLRLPHLRARPRSSTRSAPPAPASAGITARTSSRRSGRRCSPLPTAPSSPSAGTTWAGTASGCATARGTSSTTRISRPSRRSPSTGTRSRRAM